MRPLTLSTEGETGVVVKRRIAAAPEEVYRAHLDPTLIQQWMLGPQGWTMPACLNEQKPGGAIRYEWSDGQGNSFCLTGELVELDPPRRIEHLERMHLPDPTDIRVVTTFEPDGAGTVVTMRMTLPEAAMREAMLSTGMEHGMEASYARLEHLLG